MKHEAYDAMQARLNYVRDLADRLDEVGRDPRGMSLARQYRNEQRALEEALVGEEPLVLDALDHLRQRYADSDLVIWSEEKILMRLGGNEHWVLADVAIGDDYGNVDFWKPYAIWRNTGALYRVINGGEVVDDPFYVPAGSPYTGPVEEPHDPPRVP